MSKARFCDRIVFRMAEEFEQSSALFYFQEFFFFYGAEVFDLFGFGMR
jgi:hypothetical protein